MPNRLEEFEKYMAEEREYMLLQQRAEAARDHDAAAKYYDLRWNALTNAQHALEKYVVA